jgi:hypothetical protein
MQTLKGQEQHGGGKNVDIDLIKDFSFFMLKCSEVNLAHVITSLNFNESLIMFVSVIESINSRDLNKELTEYFSSIVNRTSTKFAR